MALALLPEISALGVEGAEGAHAGLGAALPEVGQSAAQRGRVRRFHRAEAAVAAALVGRAERVAAGVRHRAQAGRAVRDHHADRAAPLALEADAVGRDIAACGPARNAPSTSSSCTLLMGQPRSSKSTMTWSAMRRRSGERLDVLRLGVDDRRGTRCTSVKLRSAWIPPPWHRRRWSRATFEELRTGSDALGVVRRADRALDERHVVGALDPAREASRKLAISTAPATASSSSSQSRRLSWQPSQEANFQTASFGLRGRAAFRPPGS